MRPFKRALVLTCLENLGLTLIRTLAAKGVETIVAGAGPGRLLRLSRHCGAYARLAETSAEYAAAPSAAVDRAVRLALERGIDLVVPVDVPGALFAAALKPRLPDAAFFPSPEPGALRLLNDKWTFYGFLRKLALPSPRTWLLENAGQASALPLPLVLKPLAACGGIGVAVARDAADRDARLSGGPGRPGFPVLAQEFIEGEEVSFSFLADRGELLVWCMHVHPGAGAKEYIDDPRVVELGRRIAAASAYHGVGNIDMRYTRGRESVLVIECNPRFWGTFKYTLGLGIDYLERGLELAAGRPSARFDRAPTAFVPGLMAVAKRILTARGAPPPASRPYLRQKLGDPAPELYHGVRHLLGIKGEGV